MKTLAISKNIEVILPKMGIMTHLVELTRHDYIYVKDQIKINDVLSIEVDKSRFWEENSLVKILLDVASLACGNINSYLFKDFIH